MPASCPGASAWCDAWLRSARGVMVAAGVDAIWAQLPSYRDSPDATLRSDVAEHVAAVFGVFLDWLAEDRPARRADFAATREQASRRTAQGISLADLLQSFLGGHPTLCQSVLDSARGHHPAPD